MLHLVVESSVDVNGVAERIGIQEGDVVTQVNQRPVDNMDS